MTLEYTGPDSRAPRRAPARSAPLSGAGGSVEEGPPERPVRDSDGRVPAPARASTIALSSAAPAGAGELREASPRLPRRGPDAASAELGVLHELLGQRRPPDVER